MHHRSREFYLEQSYSVEERGREKENERESKSERYTKIVRERTIYTCHSTVASKFLCFQLREDEHHTERCPQLPRCIFDQSMLLLLFFFSFFFTFSFPSAGAFHPMDACTVVACPNGLPFTWHCTRRMRRKQRRVLGASDVCGVYRNSISPALTKYNFFFATSGKKMRVL